MRHFVYDKTAKLNFIITYFKGGIVRFSAGVMPLSSAFLEWIMKCLAGDRDETLYMKSPKRQQKQQQHAQDVIPET